MIETVTKAIIISQFGTVGLRLFDPIPPDFPDEVKVMFDKRLAEAKAAAATAIEAMRPEIMRVFESYLSPEYSVPECITARQISDDMMAMIDAALEETND